MVCLLYTSQHEKFSGKSIKYFDPELNESYTPYVIETSIGVDRMFLSIMSASYCEEQLEHGESQIGRASCRERVCLYV